VGFLFRAGFAALGLWLADRLLAGVVIADDWSLAGSALLLGIVNAVVRPIFILLTLPITVMTLGLFLWAINALMILLVASLVDGFRVESFGTALVAAALVSVAGWLGASFRRPQGRGRVQGHIEVKVRRKDRRGGDGPPQIGA